MICINAVAKLAESNRCQKKICCFSVFFFARLQPRRTRKPSSTLYERRMDVCCANLVRAWRHTYTLFRQHHCCLFRSTALVMLRSLRATAGACGHFWEYIFHCQNASEKKAFHILCSSSLGTKELASRSHTMC